MSLRTRITLYAVKTWCRIIDISKAALCLTLAWLLNTFGIPELLFIAGVVCLAVGVGMVYVPAAWISVGVVLMVFAYLSR